MEKIGVYGGSFDPIHRGHVSLAEYALAQAGLQQLVFLPAGIQPFKTDREMASAGDRIQMIKFSISDNYNFLISPMETRNHEVSYTYNSLKRMQQVYENCRIYFITGPDSFLQMESWYNGEKLLSEFSLITGGRPGYKEEEIRVKADYYKKIYNTEVVRLDNKMLDISSTTIRDSVRHGKSIKGLVPESVERYIYEHGLYK